MAAVRREYKGLPGENATKGEVKSIFLATINGANTERIAREVLGGWRPGILSEFAGEIARIRWRATEWFPEIAAEVRRRNPHAPEWRVRSSTVFFALTEKEDQALETGEETVKRFGVRGDAPTGDGLLVRRADGEQDTAPPHEVLAALSQQVSERTGIPLKFGVKSLTGATLTAWPWDSHHGIRGALDQEADGEKGRDQ